MISTINDAAVALSNAVELSILGKATFMRTPWPVNLGEPIRVIPANTKAGGESCKIFDKGCCDAMAYPSF